MNKQLINLSETIGFVLAIFKQTISGKPIGKEVFYEAMERLENSQKDILALIEHPQKEGDSDEK